jgi:iron complex outermembrane receptor protein
MKRTDVIGSASALVLTALSGQAFAAEPATLDEIVVTATRMESSLSRTPLAVTALSGEALTEAGITNPTALQDRTVNLSIDRNNGLQITIRGVSSTDNTEKGDPSAAFLLDGVYIARPQAQEVSFFDIERVEVLRGPQGTLYGRNTTAGLVNVLAARPKDEFAASLDATVGDYSTRQITGVLNLPLGPSVAIRAALNYDYRDSYLTRGSAAVHSIDPAKENLSGRVSVSFAPNDSIDVLLRADYSTIKGTGLEAVRASNLYQYPFAAPVAAQRGADPAWIARNSKSRRVYNFADPRAAVTDDSTGGVTGEVNWRVSDAWTATYLGSYREFDRQEAFSAFIGAVPGFALSVPATFDGDYSQASHEVRFAFQGERLNFQTGAYYFREESGIALLLLGLQGPAPGVDGYVFGFPQDTVSKSLAYFGQGTFSVTDQFRLTAGLRYTKDDKSRVGATILHANLGEPLGFVASPTNPRPDSLNDAAVDYSKTTGRVGFEYDVGDRTLFYGSVSTGYKAGGFNDGCLAGAPGCNSPLATAALFYSPEELTAYELGLKTQLADDRLRLFANYFHYDYNNLQLSSVSNICGGPCQVTTNAGKAKVDGVEIEALAKLNPRNRIDASLSWLDARYTEYEIVPGVDLAGEALNRSPKWAFGLGYQHTVPLADGAQIELGIHTRYSAKYILLSSGLRAAFRQPSYHKTDIDVTYRPDDGRWYLGAFAKNLENEVTVGNVALAAGFPGLNDAAASLSPPRTVGVRLGVNW